MGMVKLTKQEKDFLLRLLVKTRGACKIALARNIEASKAKRYWKVSNALIVKLEKSNDN
jgi:hypothetical protein